MARHESLLLAAQLYTHSEDVDAINSRHLADLPGEAVKFVAQDTGNPDALKSACHVRSIYLPRCIKSFRGCDNGRRYWTPFQVIFWGH